VSRGTQSNFSQRLRTTRVEEFVVGWGKVLSQTQTQQLDVFSQILNSEGNVVEMMKIPR